MTLERMQPVTLWGEEKHLVSVLSPGALRLMAGRMEEGGKEEEAEEKGKGGGRGGERREEKTKRERSERVRSKRARWGQATRCPPGAKWKASGSPPMSTCPEHRRDSGQTYGKDMEQGEHLFIAGGSANLYSLCGNQYSGSSED